VLGDRLRELHRHRVSELPIPLVPGSGQTEHRRESLDRGALLDRQPAQLVRVAMGCLRPPMSLRGMEADNEVARFVAGGSFVDIHDR
jgi:hypothetical protein